MIPLSGGPDLVAHHGQEQRLGPLGPLRLLLGQADLPDGLHPLGNVTHDPVHQGAPLVLHPAPHHFHRQERSIPPPQLGLTAAVARALDIVESGPGHLPVHELGDVHPPQLLPRKAEHAHRGVVHLHEGSEAVEQDDPVHRGVEENLELLVVATLQLPALLRSAAAKLLLHAREFPGKALKLLLGLEASSQLDFIKPPPFGGLVQELALGLPHINPCRFSLL